MRLTEPKNRCEQLILLSLKMKVFLGSDAVSIGKKLMSWIWLVIQDREDGGSRRLRIQIDMPHIPEDLNLQHHCKNLILHYHRYFTPSQVLHCTCSSSS